MAHGVDVAKRMYSSAALQQLEAEVERERDGEADTPTARERATDTDRSVSSCNIIGITAWLSQRQSTTYRRRHHQHHHPSSSSSFAHLPCLRMLLIQGVIID